MELDEFLKLQNNRSHLVILGAGASIATIPKGDKYGRRLSCMDNFLLELKIDDILIDCNLKTKSKNLEDIYSELYERSDCSSVRDKLEVAIVEKLSQLLLPNHMTIYDYLIISLRNKDLIASFNWDPLLVQAYNRMSKLTKDLPDLVFLHGSILAGFCPKCKTYGHVKNVCQLCRTPLSHPKLLYPVKNKDYNKDPFIVEQWKRVEQWIEKSTIVTFFGYSAPKTDIEAVNLLKSIYNNSSIHRFDAVEVIDIKDKSDLEDTWDDFIKIDGAHRPRYIKSYYESILAEFPRRSIEGYSKRNFGGWWGQGKNKIREKQQTIDSFFQEIQDLIEKERVGDYSV